MLINLSNHPLHTWSRHQLRTAQAQFGEVVDIPFPVIDPSWSAERILELAREHAALIEDLTAGRKTNVSVYVMGEMTFTCTMVRILQGRGYDCLASTTQRAATSGAAFQFVAFRRYPQA